MKILITQDTFVPSIDGPAFLAATSLADLEVDSAHGLVKAGKGLYVDPKDDLSRIKVSTATESRIKAAQDAVEAAKKAAKADK